MDPLTDELIAAKNGDPALRELKWKVRTGTVTDRSTTPPTVQFDGGTGIPTQMIAGYLPTDNDPVIGMSTQGTRFVFGQAGGNGQVILVKSTNHSATGSATTTISWDSETLDIGGFWSSGTTATVPTLYGGCYGLHARITGAGTWASASMTMILANGVNVATGQANGQIDVLPANGLLQLNAGATITVQIRNNGATQNCTAVLGIHRVA